jgi:hypothetical protein
LRGTGSMVQVQWCRFSGAGSVVQVRWCRFSGAGSVVQVRWCRFGGTGSVVQVQWYRFSNVLKMFNIYSFILSCIKKITKKVSCGPHFGNHWSVHATLELSVARS